MGTQCQKHSICSTQRRRKEYVNLNEESSWLLSPEVILDAQFALVMTRIDHSDRVFMMISFMSCVLKCFVSILFCVFVLIPISFSTTGRLDRLLLLFFPLLPIFTLVIHFLFTLYNSVSSVSGEPCAPALTASIHPSLLTYNGLGWLHPRRC